VSAHADRTAEIARNLTAVRARIARAEALAGRDAGSVTLVAVSKKMPPADIQAALVSGQRDFGENYAQELRDKQAAIGEVGAAAASTVAPPRWHYIGPLQRNKVKYVAGKVALIHAVDSAELVDEIDRRAATAGTAATAVDCLVQVNVAGESQKHGVSPAQLSALLDRFARTTHARCRGLMLIPPLADDPEAGRIHFAGLRRLRNQQQLVARPNVALEELSMGMSHDLEVAIAEGATLVRVGTAIFGARV
jgi:pyridoxal phosphate enzyme (YggS family)